MTLFDYLVLFILIASVAVGAMRGLMKEMLSLAGWIIAFYAASAYGVKLAELIPLSEPSVRLIVAFVGLFIGVRLLMWLLTMTLDSVIVASGLKPVDRSLGSLFGLARGAVIILAVMLVAGMTELPKQTFWQQAVLRPPLQTAALSIKPCLPDAYARYVKF